MINCGINYHRNSFAESIGLKADTYTVDELKGVCMDLTERVNTYAGQVERDADGVMVPVSYTHLDVYKRQTLKPIQKDSLKGVTVNSLPVRWNFCQWEQRR